VAGLGACALLVSSGRAQFIPGDLEQIPASAAPGPDATTPSHLQVPYIATEYVNPVVTTGEAVRIGFFVTDWNHSLVRYGDNSFRFDVETRFSADGTNWTTRTARGLPSGDHAITLGTLPAGDYQLAIQCRDAQGRASHVVWHEFLVRAAADLAIPERQVHRMTPDDLRTYGIRNDGPAGTLIPVDVGSLDGLKDPALTNHIARCLDEALRTTPVPANGYLILAAAQDGKVVQRASRRSRVVYGAAYDKAQVETNAVRTAEGLQRFLADAAARGMRKVVLLPGLYRLSASRRLSLPDRFTLDLNGATLKMNEFAGSGGVVVEIRHRTDSHLVNGTVEGDYYEHDYAHSPNNSEWVLGIELVGDCRYCSFENLTVRNITGYGVSNGTAAHDHTFPGVVDFNGSGVAYEPGTLDLATGAVDPAVGGMFTSDFRALGALATNRFLSVSKYLGYQGIRTKSWIFRAAFYDKDRAFLSGEQAFQYRVIRIPAGAAFLRISVAEESAEKAQRAELSAQRFKLPWNCTYRNLVIERCRAVGMAPSAMRNMLIEGCDFSYSGETLATCAFDAEDGWDMMQDVTIRNNVFHDNPNNELLTCAGHNFIIEGNRGQIFLWDRTNSPQVRSNAFTRAGFRCGNRNRTMHGRYQDNTYRDSLHLGSEGPSGWDIVISGPVASSRPGGTLDIGCGETGRFRDVPFGPITSRGGNFERCTFDRAHFVLTFRNQAFSACRFTASQLQHLNQTNRFDRCVFADSSMLGMSGGHTTFRDCAITNLTLDATYWAKPNTIRVEQSTIRNADKPFIYFPVYSIGTLLLQKSRFETGAAPVIQIYDIRPQPTDAQPATLAVENCTVAGTAPVVIAVSAIEREVRKAVTLRGANNTLPEGMTLIRPGDLRATWRLE
jgi:hypothetical protein